MRLLFRWLSLFVAYACLILGLLCLAVWPVSIYYKSISANVLFSIPAPWVNENPDDGDWVRSFMITLDSENGSLWSEFGPARSAAQDDNNPEMTRLWFSGYDQPDWWEDKGREFPGSDVSLNFDDPWQRFEDWQLVMSMEPYFAAVLPLWFLSILFLLPAISLLALQRVIKRRNNLRMQTNLCLHCGYNLTGVESDACPECGAARPLVTVSSAG